MTLVINSVRNDIVGQLDFGQNLGLAAVSNIGGADLAEALSSDVQRLLFSRDAYTGENPLVTMEMHVRMRSSLVKKAALCLVRLFRTNHDIINLDGPFVEKIGYLLQDNDVGVLTSVMSLVLSITSASPGAFESILSNVIDVLNRLVGEKSCPHDYQYYRIPTPWLSVKCIRYLQYYKMPEGRKWQTLNDILSKILVKSDAYTETSNKTNAENSILIEAINLIIGYGTDAPAVLKQHAAGILRRFIALKDANIRYLALDAMTRLAVIDGPASLQGHQALVLESMKDLDYSVKKKALSLLFCISDETNAKGIVEELVVILATADNAIKEDIVVKAAILSEKYCGGDFQWYITTTLQIILVAGDHVADMVWYRMVQIITNHPEIHEFTAEKVLGIVQSK